MKICRGCDEAAHTLEGTREGAVLVAAEEGAAEEGAVRREQLRRVQAGVP